jgi:hypothetical protein
VRAHFDGDPVCENDIHVGYHDGLAPEGREEGNAGVHVGLRIGAW